MILIAKGRCTNNTRVISISIGTTMIGGSVVNPTKYGSSSGEQSAFENAMLAVNLNLTMKGAST